MHRPHLRLLLLLSLWAATLPLTGCLFRTRMQSRQFSNRPLKTATQQDLVDYVNAQASKIQSLQATVDIDSSAGDPKNGKITDYKEIRGYILARKPSTLRMKGLMPVVRNTAFDMVSDGQEFKLWIPPKNRFVVGRNDVQTINSDQPMENLRPSDIYDALLIHPIDPEHDIAVLENGYEILHDPKGHRVLQEDYELVVIQKRPTGWGLSRKIVFSRTDLEPHRQFIYDEQGNLETDARYADYKENDGVGFPSRIQLFRPREEYEVTLNILKLEINKPLRDDQFALEQPRGADVVHLDHPPSSAAARPSSDTRNQR
jgi:outer membrane lipoprotein-sorting protein